MARTGVKFQAVKLFQLFNSTERGRIERALAVEGVKDNSLQQIAQSQIVIFSERLEHFQQSLLDAYAGLYTLYREAWFVSHWYQCTMVPTKSNYRLPGAKGPLVLF